jgi:hypothetical protein
VPPVVVPFIAAGAWWGLIATYSGNFTPLRKA